jgi:hypothetical protein
MTMLKQKGNLLARNGYKLVAPRPDSVVKYPGAGRRRYFLALAKNTSRPGIFETLGSYDLNTDDAELFGDDRYRRLINTLIYRSLA